MRKEPTPESVTRAFSVGMHRVWTLVKCRGRSLWQSEEGANLVLMAFVMTMLLGFAALAVDGSNVYYQTQRMQISADAAALGGARKLAADATHGEIDAEIRTLAIANHADDVTWNYINENRGVYVVARRAFPAYFARIYGSNVYTVTANSKAQYEPVVGVGGLFPFTIDCNCDDTAEGGEGGGGETPVPTPTPDPDSVDAPSSGTVQLDDNQDSSYGITYVGQTGNTWTYEVEEIDGRDLSHWLLSIDTCLSNVVGYTPGGAEVGTDGSTGVDGIKWNVNDGFSSGTFSFTLDDAYPAGYVDALAKAGNTFGTVSIRGPICDGSNTGDGGGNPDAPGVCLPTLEFETDTAGAALVAGQIIDTEWAAWGVHVTTNSPTSHPAMIFNSANPSGGDSDLGTPNEAYGGPGVGSGGGPTMPGFNNTPLGKVLIVAENSNAANPDDSANGGTLIFTFDYAVSIDDIRVLDIDDTSAAGTVKIYGDTSGTTLLATSKMHGLGDNSVQTVPVNGDGVRRMEVKFPKGGAIASIVSCRSGAQTVYNLSNLVWSDLDGDGIQDAGEPGISGVKLELYAAGQNNVIATTTTNTGGEYVFTNLPNGNYEVKIAPSNFQVGGKLFGASYSPKDALGNGGAAPTNTPTPSPTPSPTNTPTPAAAGYCQVTYTVASQWGNGFNADVTIKNLSSTAWGSWSVKWKWDGNQNISNAWNGTKQQNGKNVTITNAGYNGNVQANGTVSFGFQASYSGSNVSPTSFKVNGIDCTGSGGGGGSSPTNTPVPTATPTSSGGGGAPTPLVCTVNENDIDAAVTAMNTYGLITLNDLQSFGEVDHFAFIGGSLLTANSVQFGTHSTGVACSTRSLTVVGNIASGSPLNIQKGSLALKGQLQGGRSVNYNGGQGCGLIADSSLSAAGITAYMQGASASLASIPANNVDPAVNAGGNLMFDVQSKTANGLAIFDITGSQLFNSAGGVIEFSNSANAATILVNVSGSSMNWTHGNMGNWLTSYSSNITKVIWNFHQATSINTNSRRFAGAILAPYADMNAGSGNLEGSVVVKNLVNAGEIHNPVFSLSNKTPLTTACDGLPTPTPTNTPPPASNTPTPVPGVNDDTKDSDFDPSNGRAVALVSSLDNSTVDGGFVLRDPGPQSAIISVSDNQNSTYEITLLSAAGNTWTYRVREVSGHHLDEWGLGIANCLDHITGYTPVTGFASGTDGETGFTGIRWNVSNSFSEGTFSITLDNSYQAGPTQALVKANGNSAEVAITGPDCSLIGEPIVEEPSDGGGAPGGGGSDGNCACEGGDAGFEYGVEYVLHEPDANAPGNFGWLRWEGDGPSTVDLEYNINFPEQSPILYIGDWVEGTTGIKNSVLLQTAFEQWIGKEVTIPIYNEVVGTGSNAQYRICTFAVFELIDYDRSSKTIRGTFVRSLIHGKLTDVNHPDVGARDVRMIP